MVAFHAPFELTVHELERFKDFSLVSGMLSATAYPTNFAQNRQNLPKSAQRRNFEVPTKIEILEFFKKKNCTCRGCTRACFHRLDFQSKSFLYVLFIVKKRPLYVNFSISPCGK
jgi:hypothetical protein